MATHKESLTVAQGTPSQSTIDRWTAWALVEVMSGRRTLSQVAVKLRAVHARAVARAEDAEPDMTDAQIETAFTAARARRRWIKDHSERDEYGACVACQDSDSRISKDDKT